MPELLELLKEWDGFHPINEIGKPKDYDRKIAEAQRLIINADNLAPHRHAYLIQEAMTTSDFPYLFGDVLDRQVLANYQATDPVWKLFSRKGTNRDFKAAYLFAITGGDNRLARVAEKGEYLASPRSEERYEVFILKYGRQFDISWEALINDDLDALKDTPKRFADGAIKTEEFTMCSLYAGDVGAHADNVNLYQIGVNASADALDVASLQAGLLAMSSMVDAAGEPIKNKAKYLVVPPVLEIQARQILTSAVNIWLADADDVGDEPRAFPTRNIIKDMGLQLVIDPWLPICDVTSDDEGWYLFANPSEIAALEGRFLRGHETPEICMKGSDKVTITGAPMSPFSGDFVSDNVLYRVRHCFGGAKLDWRATYMGGYQG